jgi:hypothetical protein
MSYGDGIRNAVIESTFLGVEDHGCLTFVLSLSYGSSVQGFGTYSIDHAAKVESIKTTRRPSIIAGAAIKAILMAVGAEKWEDLKGKHVRAVIEGGQIRGIGHIIHDKWFRYNDLFDQLKHVVSAEGANPDIIYLSEKPEQARAVL